MPAVCDTDADNILIRLLLTPEGRADPYHFYDELREAAPVLRSTFGPVVLSGYEDCAAALRDPRLGRGTALRAAGEAPLLGFAGFDLDPEARQAFFESAGNNMLFADPPDHTRLRRLVSRAFTPQRVEALRPAVEEMVSGFIDAILDERRRAPGDDLLSGLVASREAGDALSDDEVIATAILLFAAGFETTTNLIGNGLLALLQHPDQQDLWRRDPGLARSGVEELLRWDSPVQLNMRTALEPAEVGGEALSRGETVIVLQGGANHDPARFDQPDRFDIGRSDNAPLSFGWGIHHCLGAPLARMEGQVVFNALLSRCRTIEARFETPEWRPTLTLRGLSRLPVAVTA